MSDTGKNIILIIVFVVSMILIFMGQRNIGYQGLAIEVVGLVGLLGVLYTYNRKYK